tara:strand:- start:140 stop:880 length:741 start_codon:yes stop_codon:yes gene_type:complete
MMLNHLDLFSGIGGFALAARWAGLKTMQFVENEPYAQKVLKKNFPDVPIHEDIKDFKADEFPRPFLCTFGYPCQPFSHSGIRRGNKDDRHLWPEAFRIVQECRPDWVLGENVTGHISMGIDEVLSDLEGEGYSCRAFHIGAVAVNAPHRRMRIFIVGNSNRKSLDSLHDEGSSKGSKETSSEESIHAGNSGFTDSGRIIDASCLSKSGVGRVAHGVPSRVDRLRGLGNAVVPRLAYEIILRIKECR